MTRCCHLQNYGSGDKNHPPGPMPPFTLTLIFCSSSWTHFLESVYTSCFSLPLLPLQPIPTWRTFPLLHGSGFCQVTSTLPAAKSAEHVSVFTSLNLIETFNPVGCSPLLDRLSPLSLHDSSPIVYLLPLRLFLLNLRALSGSGWHHSYDCK